MAHVTIFLKKGKPHQAVITDAPNDGDERFDLMDAVAAFMDGHAKTLVASRDHRVDIIR